MKFQRYGRYEGFEMTERRKAAFLRKQRNELERYPLFADQIQSEQHSLEVEAAQRERQRRGSTQDMRDFRARQWRRGRALYFAQPEHIKAVIREKWNKFWGNRDSGYFCALVDVESGEQARRLAAIAIEDAKILERVRASMPKEIYLLL